MRVSSPKDVPEESEMAERESPSVVIVNPLALRAQVLFGEFVSGRGTQYWCEDWAQIRTRSNTTRVADLAIWHHEQIETPAFVLEVREPSEAWLVRLERMLDYLRVGVPVVVILDPKTESASVFRPGTRQETFEKDQTLTIPDVLPGFEVPVARFFEE
jgi:Uma2 family endonuclease